MAPRESPKYLQNSNYHLSLGESNYVASFQDKIAIGKVEMDPVNGKLRFAKRSVFLPPTAFKSFSECLNRAYQCFLKAENGSPFEEFSKLLYKYTKVHHVLCGFGQYDDSEPCFSISTKWFFRQDRHYEKLVGSGLADPIQDEGLEDHHYLWLKNGVYLKKSECEILHSQWATILEHSLFANSLNRRKVLEFADYALSNDTSRQYLEEKMAQYETLNFKAKIKMISHLLDQMFEAKGLDTEPEECNKKNYLDIFAGKTMLIFPLWFWNLQPQE